MTHISRQRNSFISQCIKNKKNIKKMNTLKSFICVAISMFATFSLFSQTQINQYKVSESNQFNNPIIIDSTNTLGKSFSPVSFLHTPQIPNNYNSLKTSTISNDFIINNNRKNNAFSLVTYYFSISVSKFTKAKIEVFTNDYAKVSMDNNKQGEKLSKEDSLSETNISFEVSMIPGEHIFGIRLLQDNSLKNHYLKTIYYGDTSSNNNTINTQSGLTLNTMLCGENPYSVSISNNGDYYLAKYYNTKQDGTKDYRYEVRQVSDNKIVYKDEDNTSIAWLPKSSLLYYVDDNDLYFLNPKDGSNKLIAKNIPSGDISFLNNEKQFILSITETNDNTKDDLHRMYLPDDRIPAWRDRTNLSLYNLDDNSLTPLTYGYHSVYLNDISQDNNKILVSIKKDSITKRPFSFTSIYEIDLNTMKIDTIVKDDGYVISGQYLIDNENLVILASNDAFNGIGLNIKKGQKSNLFNQSIYLMNLKTKQVKAIGKYFNPSVSSVIVKKDNLFLNCIDKDSINEYRYNIKDNKYYKLNLGVDITHNFSISQDEQTAIYYGENYNKPNRVFLANNISNNISSQEVYFPKKDVYQRMNIGQMTNWSFKAKDGSIIDGRIYYPADFDKTKKYPMIVYYYGGTEPTDRSFEMRYSAYLYTTQGYIVYDINPSGTIGWGQEFAARHVNAWGDYTSDEIIEGVKKLCNTFSYINKDKIGCMGASYGGFMTDYLMTKTNIFACAVSHAGISNITSYWGEGYWGYSYSAAASADSYPWNNKSLYTDHSPLFYANKITKPLLLLQGTSDTNVPLGESIQLYNALKILGKEVEFVTVKGENHGIVDFNKRTKWQNTIFAWFNKHLKDDSSWWNDMYPKQDL